MSPIIHENDFLHYYDAYYKKIYNYIIRRIFHKEKAEDLTAQVFFKALKYVKKHEPDINNFNAWIYKIAINEILMHHRREKKIKMVNIESEEAYFHNILTNHGISENDRFVDFFTIHQALKTLKPVESQIIELYYFENLSYIEISKIVAIKEMTIGSILYRGLKKIKDYLNKGEVV